MLMELGLQEIAEWFEDNRDWLLVPLLVDLAVVILGIVIIILTGKDAGFMLKLFFVILVIAAPIAGYYLGEYIDPYIGGIVGRLTNQ